MTDKSSPPAAGMIADARAAGISRTWIWALVGIGIGASPIARIDITHLLIVVAGLSTLYLVVLGWRMITTSVALGDSTVTFTDVELAEVAKATDLPRITVLVPIRREHPDIVKQQANAFEQLAYPRERLEIVMLVDADDPETLAYARRFMPSWVQVRSVPEAEPRTKPRVLNHGLHHTEGDLVGVWDGEDWPEPTQLLRVAAAFRKVPDDVVCVQGRLVFRHAEHNLLTRWASIAYHGNFSLFIPALARLNLPVPLGGTSNFIKRGALTAIGGWDSWNVTEDLDLGVRISRNGWGVRVIDTETLEESNPDLRNCINQWSRWEKGKIQTWLVHMRNPFSLWRDLGPVGFLTFQLVVGIPVLALLLNPIFFLTTIVYVLTSVIVGFAPAGPVVTQAIAMRDGVEALFPAPIIYVAAFCQIAGNLWFAWLAATGALVRKEHGLVPAALLCFFHWLLLSAATYKGLWQMLTQRAHHWELTRHGLIEGTSTAATTTTATATATSTATTATAFSPTAKDV